MSEQTIQFAKVSGFISNWQGGEHGYNMKPFIKLEAIGSTMALIDSEIKRDSAPAMRLATVQELEFLKSTLELDQGRCLFM